MRCAASCVFAQFEALPLGAAPSLLFGRAVLPQTRHSDIYLTALGIALTVVYGWGLITRPHRQMLRMGADSVAVLALRGRHRELLAVSNG